MNRDGAASLGGVVNGDERRSVLLQRARARRERGLCALVFDALKNRLRVEAMRNPDGYFGYARLGGRMRRIGTMAAARAEAIICSIAVNHDKKVKRHQPLPEHELALDGSRVAGQVSPVVGAPGFAIRHRESVVDTPQNDGAQEIMTAPQCGLKR